MESGFLRGDLKVNHTGAVLDFQTRPLVSLLHVEPHRLFYCLHHWNKRSRPHSKSGGVLFCILQNVSLFIRKTFAVQFPDEFGIRIKNVAAFSLKHRDWPWPGWVGRLQTHPVSAVVAALTCFYPIHSSQSTWLPTCSLCSLWYLMDSTHSLVCLPYF